MRTPSHRIAFAVAAATVLLCTTTSVQAQEVRYKTVSKMKIEGLGFLGGLLGNETKEEVSISGNLKRVDNDDTSTITNLDKREIVYLNHDKKEYSVMTFEDMMQMVNDMTAYGQTRMAEVRDSMNAEMERSDEDAPEYDVHVDLKVDDTGKKQKIDGREAHQKVLVIETTFTPKDADADSLPSGKIFAVDDVWLSDDVPEMEASEEFDRKMAEAMQQEIADMDMANIMSTLLQSDPRIGETLETAEEELNKLEGTKLLSTMHIVTVPQGMDLDVELALGEKKEEKKGGGFGGFLKQAAKASGVDVGDDEEKTKSEPKQMTLFSMESRTEDIKAKGRDPDFFQIPSNYKEVEFKYPQMPGMEDSK